MTVLVYANEQADDILSRMDTFLTVTLELLKDTDIPLDDRWDLYLKIEKLLPVENYITDSIDFISDNEVYDRMFPNGRGIKYNSSIDESIAENSTDWIDDDCEDEWAKRAREVSAFEIANRDKWREMVLKEGSAGCVFDW